MKTSRNISELHHEDQVWLNKVLFYQDELQLLQRRLQKVASQAGGGDGIYAEVEHFENQLRIQQKHIDEIKNRIQLNEARLTGTVSAGLNTVEERERIIHMHEKKAISDFEESFNRLRADFRKFLKAYL